MTSAFLDASVLYPATTRSVLMHLAAADLFRVLWSEDVHREWTGALRRDRPDLKPARIARTRALMEAAIEGASVTGYEPLIERLVLPDPDDRHVLAAAIHGGAEVIVTRNLRHFPAAALAPFHVVAQHPDVFVRALLEVDPEMAVTAFAADRGNLRNPPMSVEGYLEALERNGLAETATALRRMPARI